MSGTRTNNQPVRQAAQRDELLAKIARQLGFETLATRGSDRDDFREVSVESIRDALARAYDAGLAAGRAAVTPRSTLPLPQPAPR